MPTRTTIRRRPRPEPERPQSEHPHRWWFESWNGASVSAVVVVDEAHSWWDEPRWRQPERPRWPTSTGVRSSAEWLRDIWEEPGRRLKGNRL